MEVQKSPYNSFVKNNAFYFVLIILLIVSYWTTIFKDVVLEYDDKNLLNSLINIHSIKDYFFAIQHGIVFDVQPIRDLSYLIDMNLKNHFAYSFHFTNLVIWFLICTVVHRLLSLQIKKTYIVNCLVLLFCFSPVSTSSVAWIAARKHLLSTLFILLCTYIVVKNKEMNLKNFAFIIIFYLLSCFSQPINALWPVWMAFYFYFEGNLKKNKLLVISTFLMMLAVLALNYYYYTAIYSDKIGLGEKFQSDFINIGSTALAFGRYFYLSLFPFSALPVSHNKDALENIIGLILLLLVVCLLVFKPVQNKKKYLLSLMYFALPLLLVSIKPTNIFCSDTYLLNASIGIYLFIAYLLDSSIHDKKLVGLLILYVTFLFIYNLNYINVFSNETHLWQYAQEKEANSQTRMIVALEHVKKNEFAEAYTLIDELQLKSPEAPYLPQLISESVFFNDKFTGQKKIELLEKIENKTPAVYFYLSVLYARENSIDLLRSNLTSVLKDSKMLRLEFKGREERVVAIYQYTCSTFKISDCAQSSTDLKNQFNKVNFDESLYTNYLNNLFSNKIYTVNLRLK